MSLGLLVFCRFLGGGGTGGWGVAASIGRTVVGSTPLEKFAQPGPRGAPADRWLRTWCRAAKPKYWQGKINYHLGRKRA